MHVRSADLQAFTCTCMQEPMEVKGIELLQLELGAAVPGGYWEPYLGLLREHYVFIATEPSL